MPNSPAGLLRIPDQIPIIIPLGFQWDSCEVPVKSYEIHLKSNGIVETLFGILTESYQNSFNFPKSMIPSFETYTQIAKSIQCQK